MIPKIKFRYSWIYDERYRNNPKIQATLKKQNKAYPPRAKILRYIGQIEEDWKKIDKKVLKGLEKISGLKWNEKEIICYCIGRGIPFSDPLTVPISRGKEYFIDTLIHELIHQIMTQGNNLKKSKKAWDFFFEKYKKESNTTKIHIPLHAIHSSIFYRFFNEKRLNRDCNNMEKLQDYKASWDIVKREGYEKIVNEFRNRIK